jgi:hypothetical protein
MNLSLMRVIGVAVAVIGLSPILNAQSGSQPPLAPAPIPPVIAAAKKVFISNGGGAALDDAMGITLVKGGPDRAYNQFYAAMKSWGRYDLVSSPSDADLILQIRFMLSDSGTQFLAKSSPFSAVTPVMGHVELAVRDPKTNVTVWTIFEYAQGAILEGNREKNFNLAMNAVVDRLKAAVLPAPAASQ